MLKFWDGYHLLHSISSQFLATQAKDRSPILAGQVRRGGISNVSLNGGCEKAETSETAPEQPVEKVYAEVQGLSRCSLFVFSPSKEIWTE